MASGVGASAVQAFHASPVPGPFTQLGKHPQGLIATGAEGLLCQGFSLVPVTCQLAQPGELCKGRGLPSSEACR